MKKVERLIVQITPIIIELICNQLYSLVHISTYNPYMINKTITRTIRYDKGYDEVIQNEATKKGVTINAIMEQMIRKYVLSYRYYENLGTISFSLPSMLSLLEIMDEDRLVKTASAIGLERPMN